MSDVVAVFMRRSRINMVLSTIGFAMLHTARIMALLFSRLSLGVLSVVVRIEGKNSGNSNRQDGLGRQDHELLMQVVPFPCEAERDFIALPVPDRNKKGRQAANVGVKAVNSSLVELGWVGLGWGRAEGRVEARMDAWI